MNTVYVHFNIVVFLVSFRYLRQVINETLRCSVPGAFGARVQYSDSKLGGYDIPKNVSLF